MTFNADIGNVNPSVVTLSNNVGESTYSSNAVGEETVRIFVGNVEVSNIKFNVHASVINRIYYKYIFNHSLILDLCSIRIF